MNTSLTSINKHHTSIRVILLLLVVALVTIQLVLTFRGLFHAEAMDQAQIARNIARGDGFTTQFIRPVEFMDHAKALKDKDIEKVDLDQFRDTNYAPLYPYTLALALKITGQGDFEATRLEDISPKIYAPDRVIAGVSALFFIIALIQIFYLSRRLFDEYLAYATVGFIALSNLYLEFATSGLPQMLMLCFFIGAAHCFLKAMDHSRAAGMKKVIFLAAAFTCIAMLCLTSWMGIWVALGALLFAAVFFRPHGIYSILGVVILLILLIIPILMNASATGSLVGNLYYEFYNFDGAGSEMVMRLTNVGNLPLNSSSFWLRLMGKTFAQLNNVYTMMGAIIVVPLFFLSLFTRYKKESTNTLKWLVFFVWLFVSIGMALFGAKGDISASQLYILLGPLFTAYGLSLVFMSLARLQLQQSFNMARNASVFILLLLSAGPFLAKLPEDLHRGIWLGGFPHFPPYYPAALNTRFSDITNEKDLILSDQPWAVAWYADRKSMWTPLNVKELREDITPILERSNYDIQGILVTPQSYIMADMNSDERSGLNAIEEKSGDFFPVAIEGMLCSRTPKQNIWFADIFAGTEASNGIGALVSQRGDYWHRYPVLGYHMMYYAKQEIPRQ